MALFAIVASLLWAARWTMDASHGNADVFYYARAALAMAGMNATVADAEAARFTSQAIDPSGRETYTPEQLRVSDDPRYAGFFRPRLLYPAVAALFVPALGADGLTAAALIAAVLTGVAVGWFTVKFGRSTIAGLLAIGLVFVFPSGRYLAWVTADCWVIAIWTIALVAAGWFITSHSRWALGGFFVAMAAMALAKIGNVWAFVAALAGATALELWARRSLREMATLLGVGGAVLGASIVAFAALGLPGVTDQVEDVLTQHFRAPDVAKPWRPLALRLIRFVPARLLEASRQPALVAGAFGGGLGLISVRGPWIGLFVASAFATFLLVLIHPVRSEIDRLLAPAWVPLSVGLALASTTGLLRLLGGSVRRRQGSS